MINTDGNPDFLNAFLDYTTSILNKSPGTVKEYNYDLNRFLKYISFNTQSDPYSTTSPSSGSPSKRAIAPEKIQGWNLLRESSLPGLRYTLCIM